MDVGRFLEDLPEPFDGGEVLSLQENRLVLRTVDTSTRSDVVLKCLVAPYSPEERQLFAREYLLLDAVAHPYWVDVGRFGETSGGAYFTLEHVSGVPLSSSKLRGWTPEVVEVSRRVLSGLDALHRLGFAQVDLKPEQVLVSWANETSLGWTASPEEVSEQLDLRLLDLGLAAPFGHQMRPSGTLGYMAPEILRQEPDWDGRADLFSFGAILYELLYGEPVFRGETARELLDQQLRGADLVFPEAEFVPTEMCRLLEELLSSTPAQRPLTAWDTWSRIRELVPHQGATELPRQLTSSPKFMFRGREAEIAAFEQWCAVLEAEAADRGHLASNVESAGSESLSLQVRCVVSGEIGIGKRRLVDRLQAVAQTRGWMSAPVQAPDTIRFVADSSFKSSVVLMVFETQETPVCGNHGTRTANDESRRQLRIDLGPLGRDAQIVLARGLGVESEVLANHLADASLGNPSLLLALVEDLSPEARLAIRHVSEPNLEDLVLSEACPTYWRTWADRVVSCFGSEGGDWLFTLGALSVSGFVDCSASMDLAISDRDLVIELRDRGLVIVDNGRARMQSPAWGAAFTTSDVARFRHVAALLLPEAREDAVGCAWLAVRARDVKAVELWIGKALDALNASDQVAGELDLLASSLRLGATIEEDLLLRACSLLFSVGASEGREVPRPPSLLGAGGFLYLWWLSSREPRMALEELRGTGMLTTHVEELRQAAFLLEYRLSLQLESSGSPLDRLRTLRTDDESWMAKLSVSEATGLAREGALTEAEAVLRRVLERADLLRPHEEAVVQAQRATVLFLLGELNEANRCAERCYNLAQQCGLHFQSVHALQVLAAVAYQEGALDRVADWNARLFRENSRREQWETSIRALTNLALVKVQKGQIGSALSTIRDAAGMLGLVGRHALELHQAQIEMVILVRSGQLDIRRFERLVESAEGVERAHFLSVVGEALLLGGNRESGRHALELAEVLFRENEALDDVAATLADWALVECALEEQGKALEVYQRLEATFDVATPLTKTMVVLAESEMARLGWLDVDPASDAVVQMLQDSSNAIGGRGLGYWSWRPQWRLGQVYLSRGDDSEAERCYDSAFKRLREVAESIAEGFLRERFLQLPAQDQFLSELSRRSS